MNLSAKIVRLLVSSASWRSEFPASYLIWRNKCVSRSKALRFSAITAFMSASENLSWYIFWVLSPRRNASLRTSWSAPRIGRARVSPLLCLTWPLYVTSTDLSVWDLQSHCNVWICNIGAPRKMDVLSFCYVFNNTNTMILYHQTTIFDNLCRLFTRFSINNSADS